MIDDLNELRTFDRIVHGGSLSAAARDLGISLAVVSKRLTALERRVQVRLLNRSTRRASLTASYPAARRHEANAAIGVFRQA